MRQAIARISQRTTGRGLVDITADVADWVGEQDMTEGLLTLFIQHTSASLTIQENADPDVIRDLNDFFSRLVPDDPRLYRHTCEGDDDMPAHIRSALTATQLSIPLVEGRLALGAWQGVYVFEHRATPHTRQVMLHLLGE